jgi:hypothetical protein
MRIFLLFCCLLVACSEPELPVPLIQHDEQCTIVVDLDPFTDVYKAAQAYKQNDPELLPVSVRALAALELQQYLAQLGGMNPTLIPIIDDQFPHESLPVFIGPAPENVFFKKIQKRWEKRWKDSDAVMNQSFRLDSFTRDSLSCLVISGESHIGELYGVYELLYQLGVRWLSPAKYDEIIPDHSQIIINPLNNFYTPFFELRGFTRDEFTWDQTSKVDADGFKGFLRWMARNRLNTLPYQSGFEQEMALLGIRPQYYATLPSPWRNSAPKITTLFDTLNVPHYDPLVFVRQQDHRMASIVQFVDWLQSEQGIMDTERIVLVLTDSAMAQKQKDLSSLANRIPLILEPMWRCLDHALCDPVCDVNQPLCAELFRLNAGNSNTIIMCEPFYHTRLGQLPLVLTERLAVDIPIYAENGLSGVLYPNVRYHNWGMQIWLNLLYGHLLWQPNTNVVSLFEQFFNTYYGSAAEPMKNVFLEYEKATANMMAWRYELPLQIERALATRVPIRLEHFDTHLNLSSDINASGIGTDWEKTFQVIYELQYALTDILAQEIPEEIKERIKRVEIQLAYAQVVIQLYDNVIQLISIDENEPEMRVEAAIRLRERANEAEKMQFCDAMGRPVNALQASGLEPFVEPLLERYQTLEKPS